MTDEAPSIWRKDEGQSTQPQAGEDRAAPDLFGGPAPSESKSSAPQAQPVDLWRQDEGKPSQQSRLTTPSAAPEPRKRRKENRRKEKKAGRISWPAVILTTVILSLLALLIDGGMAALTIRDRLDGVATSLEQVESHLSAGEMAQAAESVEAGAADVQSAEDATNRPSIVIGSLIPGADSEVDAVDGAVEAAGLSVEAARSIVSGAELLGLDEDGVPSELYVDGQVQLDEVRAARTEINAAEFRLIAALLRLEELDPRLEQLRNPIDEAHSRIGDTLARVTDARTVMDLLTSLFGGQDERRYLLAFQAPGEARGTGGLIGMAAVLEANDGRLELGEPLPYSEFAPRRANDVEAPAWFRQSYGPQQALQQWPQANVSPNHAIVSAVLLKMYEEGTGERLDGVVTMDPLAMRELMRGMDPIEIRNPSRVVDATNVAEVLLRDSYTEFATPEEQNIFLAKVVDGFWAQVSEGNVDLERFAEGLGAAVAQQHLKLYSSGREQANIEELELDGSYVVGPNSQMVFNVNYAANKVDYFLHRDLTTEVELGSGGEAQVTTTMELENRAPSGPASALLGQDNGLEPGVNRMTINLLMPPGSAIDSFSVGGEQREPFTYADEDSPVVWDILQIPPGGSETVSLTYTIPNALQALEGALTFDFSLYPQATVNPDDFSLTISPPPGLDVVGVEGGLSESETPSLSGSLEEPVSVRVLMEGD